MKYIHLFETVEDFEEVYNGSEYIEPWTSYIRETKTITFNKIPPHDYSKDYFTIETLGNGEVKWYRRAMELPKYRVNGGEWIEPAISVSNVIIPVENGDIVELSYDAQTYSQNIFYSILTVNTNFKLYGNIESLLYGDDFVGKTDLKGFEFSSMFYNATGLTSAKNLILPAMTLTTKAYYQMFRGCINMTEAPELPATSLASQCYDTMFGECMSLTVAPNLPATTLAEKCYNWMFEACSGLTEAPVELPSTALSPQCYYMMFDNCKSLEIAPILPAQTIIGGAYSQMFKGCESLKYIECLATDVTQLSGSGWVQGVSENGTFVKAQGMNDWPQQQYGNYDAIPYGWTVQDAS